MKQQTSFTICNETGSELEIIHEPECFIFDLPKNQEVSIETDACLNSVHLKIYLENGKITISIFNENSLYSIMCNGKNAFEEYLE